MSKEELAKKIKQGSLLKGNFKLRSGKTSSLYFDKYRFESNPILLKRITELMEKNLPKEYNKIAGLELGGIPLATSLSVKTGKPCLYVRKKPKKYGTQNLVEGGFKKGEKAVVIEDIVTTGGQVYSSVLEMRELGLIVKDVICVIDRQQGGVENLNNIGCSLKSIFTSEIINNV